MIHVERSSQLSDLTGHPGLRAASVLTHGRTRLRHALVVCVLAIPLASPACGTDDAGASARTAEARLAYLAGAYYRYGVDDRMMRFANAAHKADLIADLLREAGATAVTRETIRGLPNTNIVRFTPSAELKAVFASRSPV